MTDAHITVPAGETGILRLFTLAMADPAATDLRESLAEQRDDAGALLARALGATDIDPYWVALLDSSTMESAQMCGSCHDVVTPADVHLERTYAEWQESFFSDIDPLSGGPAVYGLRCGSCHMGPPVDGPIADAPGVRADRRFHSHGMVGVDMALHDWPDAELGPQLRAEQLERIEFQRKSALCATICVSPADAGGSNVDIYLHNEFAAHAWPSGAAQDRRAWLELRAFVGDDAVYEAGVIEDGTPVASVADDSLWQLRDFIYGEGGETAHMFWDVRSVEGQLLPASDHAGPMNDRPTGKPFTMPMGTLRLGYPARAAMLEPDSGALPRVVGMRFGRGVPPGCILSAGARVGNTTAVTSKVENTLSKPSVRAPSFTNSRILLYSGSSRPVVRLAASSRRPLS